MKDCGEIKHIECHGAPYEMGFQYGRETKDEISLTLKAVPARNKTLARKMKSRLMECLPDIWEEMKGVANGTRAKINI